MCNVLCCYVIRISGLEGLVTTNSRTNNLVNFPKCGKFTLKSTSEILELNLFLIYLKIKVLLSNFFIKSI